MGVNIRTQLLFIAAVAGLFLIVEGMAGLSQTGAFVGEKMDTKATGYYCDNASVLIRGAEYDAVNGILYVIVQNEFDKELSITTAVEYPDFYENNNNTIMLAAGESQIISIDNVSEDIEILYVKSSECSCAQDLIKSRAIKGIGF